MKHTAGLLIGACVAVALLAGSAVASRATASTPGSLTIGILDSLTGPSAGSCAEELNGMKLAVAEAGHMKETVNGKKVPYLRGVSVKLSPQDDQSTAAGGVTAFRDLADSSAVSIVGPCNGNVAVANLQSIDTTKIPIVYSTAGDNGIVDPAYAFRGGMPFQFFSGRVAQVMRGKGAKTVYVIRSNDIPVYNNMYAAIKATMSELGMSVVGDFATSSTATVNFGPAIQQINQAHPDAIAVLVRAGTIPSLLTQLRTSGVSQPVFGSGNFPAAQHAGAAVTGSIFATNYADVFTYKSSRKFTSEFEAKYQSDPNAQDANGYDAMWRVLRAIHDAGPTTVAAASTGNARVLIQKALAAQKSAEGAQGPITYLPNGDARAPGGVVQIIDDKGDLKLLPVPTLASLRGKK